MHLTDGVSSLIEDEEEKFSMKNKKKKKITYERKNYYLIN